MDTIISYSVKFGKVYIECFTDQTYGSEEAAAEKAKNFYDAYLVKVPTANLSIVKSVKRRNVKPL